jgi:hypothetical protein
MRQILFDKGMYLLELDNNGLLIWTTRYHEKDETRGTEDVNRLIEAMNILFNQDPDKHFSMLVDVRPVYEQAFYLPRSARQTFSKMMENPHIKKIAILGANTYLAILVETMSRFTEMWSKVRIFRDEDKAFGWLKDGK